MIVILCIIILVVAVYLTAMLLKRIWTGTLFDNTRKAPDKGFHLLATYATSFSLPLVSFIALYALSSGKTIVTALDQRGARIAGIYVVL